MPNGAAKLRNNVRGGIRERNCFPSFSGAGYGQQRQKLKAEQYGGQREVYWLHSCW